jgi:hypothetical protein
LPGLHLTPTSCPHHEEYLQLDEEDNFGNEPELAGQKGAHGRCLNLPLLHVVRTNLLGFLLNIMYMAFVSG